MREAGEISEELQIPSWLVNERQSLRAFERNPIQAEDDGFGVFNIAY